MKITLRKIMLTCSLALAGLQGIQAAEVQVFGGYAVTRMKSETQDTHATLNGWNTSLTTYLNNRFGLTADFAGFYGDVKPGITNGDPVTTRQYSFMGGPQFRLFHTARFESSIRAVFGGAYGYLPQDAYRDINQTTFAGLIGSNFDVKLSRRVAMRFSPGLYLTQFGTNQTQKNFRFSAGPVFEFGGGER